MTDSRKVVLWLIAEDMYNDSRATVPFTALGIGTQFGYIMAAIAGLTRVVATLLPETTE